MLAPQLTYRTLKVNSRQHGKPGCLKLFYTHSPTRRDIPLRHPSFCNSPNINSPRQDKSTRMTVKVTFVASPRTGRPAHNMMYKLRGELLPPSDNIRYMMPRLLIPCDTSGRISRWPKRWVCTLAELQLDRLGRARPSLSRT